MYKPKVGDIIQMGIEGRECFAIVTNTQYHNIYYQLFERIVFAGNQPLGWQKTGVDSNNGNTCKLYKKGPFLNKNILKLIHGLKNLELITSEKSK